MNLDAQLILDGLDGVAYLVDADGVIVAIGRPAWDNFAKATRTNGTAADLLIGSSIFGAMRGREIAAAYRRIHAGLLAGERSHVSFEYRCDAPDLRREMRMSISVLRPPAPYPILLLYQSQILSCVARPWVSLFEPDRIVSHVRSESQVPIVRICGFCQKVAWTAQSETEWIEADEYYRRGGLGDVRTSHGVCRACEVKL